MPHHWLDMTLPPTSLPPPSCLSCLQLDKLRTIIESMLSSSSTLLSMSITPHKTTAGLVPGQIDPEATCPACSLDVSHQVSLLVQRYEQLQDMVSGLAASRPSKKTKLQGQVSLSLCPAPVAGWLDVELGAYGRVDPVGGTHSAYYGIQAQLQDTLPLGGQRSQHFADVPGGEACCRAEGHHQILLLD